jgi:hypothetical protein
MDNTDAYTINASEVRLYQTIRKTLKLLPVSALTFSMGRMILPKLRLRSGKADTRRLVALCKEDLRKVMKQDLLAMADCMEDFLFNHTFTSRPYLSAPEKVLILDSPSDKIANPKQRAQMLKLCPGAKEHHFKSGGHMTMLNCQNEYFSVLRNFLVN